MRERRGTCLGPEVRQTSDRQKEEDKQGNRKKGNKPRSRRQIKRSK